MMITKVSGSNRNVNVKLLGCVWSNSFFYCDLWFQMFSGPQY